MIEKKSLSRGKQFKINKFNLIEIRRANKNINIKKKKNFFFSSRELREYKYLYVNKYTHENVCTYEMNVINRPLLLSLGLGLLIHSFRLFCSLQVINKHT